MSRIAKSKPVKPVADYQLIALANVAVPSRARRDSSSFPWLFGSLESGVYTCGDGESSVSVALAYNGLGRGMVSPKVIAAEFASAHKAGRIADVGYESVAGIPTAHGIKPEDRDSFSHAVSPPDPDSAVRATFDAATLADVLVWVSPAISTEETRYYLNGVFFHADGQDGAATLRVVATDGHRMHMDSLPLATPLDNAPGVIVSRLALAVLVKALALYPSESVVMEWCERRVRFTVGAVAITSAAIDGTFPDYTRVAPSAEESVQVFHLDPIAIAATVARAKMIRANTPAGERPINPVVGVAVGGLRLLHTGLNAGDDPAECAAGFNLAYFSAAVAGGTSPTLAIEDAGSPARVTFADRPDRLGVLMPMRIDGRTTKGDAERIAREAAEKEANDMVPEPEPDSAWSPTTTIVACEEAIESEMTGDMRRAMHFWNRALDEIGDDESRWVEMDSGRIMTRADIANAGDRIRAIRTPAVVDQEKIDGTPVPRSHYLWKEGTPWGVADSVRLHAPGVSFHSTPSHGGFRVAGQALWAMPAWLADGCGVRDGSNVAWFEEDCAWSAVAYAFPDLFSEGDRAMVDRTIQEWFPYTWERIHGRRLSPDESAALRLYANPNFHGAPPEPADRPPATPVAPDYHDDPPRTVETPPDSYLRGPVEIDLSALPGGPPWDGAAVYGVAD